MIYYILFISFGAAAVAVLAGSAAYRKHMRKVNHDRLVSRYAQDADSAEGKHAAGTRRKLVFIDNALSFVYNICVEVGGSVWRSKPLR